MIFLYERGAKVPANHLKALREAGIVPVQVDDLSKAKLIDPELAPLPVDSLFLDALHVIADSGTPQTTRFCRRFYATLAAERDDRSG